MENDWVTTYVNPALVSAGDNVLSVGMHHAALNSPDLIFEAALTARPQGVSVP